MPTKKKTPAPAEPATDVEVVVEKKEKAEVYPEFVATGHFEAVLCDDGQYVVFNPAGVRVTSKMVEAAARDTAHRWDGQTHIR